MPGLPLVTALSPSPGVCSRVPIPSCPSWPLQPLPTVPCYGPKGTARLYRMDLTEGIEERQPGWL